MRNKNTREVPWFRFGIRRSEAKPIFSLGSLFRLGIYSSLVLCCNFLEIKISLGSNFRGFLYVIQLKTSLSWIFHPAHFFAQLIFSLGSYFRGFYFRGFSNPRKFKHSEVFDVYSTSRVKCANDDWFEFSEQGFCSHVTSFQKYCRLLLVSYTFVKY